MKANAPEKIYCESDGLGNIVRAHNIKWPDGEAENIEYTRTDAFIEKAKNWHNEHISDYECEPMGEYPRLAMLDDFEKIMKGE